MGGGGWVAFGFGFECLGGLGVAVGVAVANLGSMCDVGVVNLGSVDDMVGEGVRVASGVLVTALVALVATLVTPMEGGVTDKTGAINKAAWLP